MEIPIGIVSERSHQVYTRVEGLRRLVALEEGYRNFNNRTAVKQEEEQQQQQQ